ncbi:MAG TPA: hypothetical protein VG962_02970 [Steroidobacteraceae bacterium]|nr:hypothetical protein [Steroidobacteraceae bacterium]
MTSVAINSAWQFVGKSRTSPGFSQESVAVTRLLKQVRHEILEAATPLQSQSFTKLASIASDCSQPAWDGYAAKAISKETINRTIEFLNDLPIWMEAPDVVPESDGDIAIEWYLAPNRIYSVSIGAKGPLHFSGLFGPDKERHGVEAFDGKISEDILNDIKKLLRSS